MNKSLNKNNSVRIQPIKEESNANEQAQNSYSPGILDVAFRRMNLAIVEKNENRSRRKGANKEEEDENSLVSEY